MYSYDIELKECHPNYYCSSNPFCNNEACHCCVVHCALPYNISSIGQQAPACAWKRALIGS